MKRSGSGILASPGNSGKWLEVKDGFVNLAYVKKIGVLQNSDNQKWYIVAVLPDNNIELVREVSQKGIEAGIYWIGKMLRTNNEEVIITLKTRDEKTGRIIDFDFIDAEVDYP